MIALRHTRGTMAPESLDLEVMCPVIGYANCRVLAVWFAGRRLIVPRRFDATHPLTLLIGHKALQALVAAMPGFEARVPAEGEERAYKRMKAVAEGLATGATPRSLSVALGISQRRVEQIRVEAELRGWLSYVERPYFARRTAGARSPGKPMLPEFLGTGEVFQQPPTPH